MANIMKNNFQRSQSKVWFSNAPLNSFYDDYYSLPVSSSVRSSIRSTIISEEHQNDMSFNSPQNDSNASAKSAKDIWQNRQGSPSSHKSQVCSKTLNFMKS